jgi:hypothetical protein
VRALAVYNKKDFENFLNKDKIKKQKIKKRIITSVSAVLAIVIIAGLVFLLMRDRGNYIKEDNYTEAIDFAIEKFANEKVGSFDAYARFSYNYKTSPRPDKPVEDLKDNDIYIEYDKKDDSNKDNDINEDNSDQDEESNENDNQNENTNQNPTDKPQENNPAPSPETTIYEYDHFFAIAGRGNYPGYGISGPTFIQDIRKEVCLAIKAYTTMPLAGGTDKGNYRLQYYDKQYDYVYFFLTGEVRKVDKLYLKQLDDTTGKNSYDVYNFLISLTEDKSSNIANPY